MGAILPWDEVQCARCLVAHPQGKRRPMGLQGKDKINPKDAMVHPRPNVILINMWWIETSEDRFWSERDKRTSNNVKKVEKKIESVEKKMEDAEKKMNDGMYQVVRASHRGASDHSWIRWLDPNIRTDKEKFKVDITECEQIFRATKAGEKTSDSAAELGRKDWRSNQQQCWHDRFMSFYIHTFFGACSVFAEDYWVYAQCQLNFI